MVRAGGGVVVRAAPFRAAAAPHFTDGDTETQRGDGTQPGSSSESEAEWALSPGLGRPLTSPTPWAPPIEEQACLVTPTRPPTP